MYVFIILCRNDFNPHLKDSKDGGIIMRQPMIPIAVSRFLMTNFKPDDTSQPHGL